MSDDTSRDSVESEASDATPFDPERIIAELDAAHHHIPEAAIRAARTHRDVMVPRLIQTIRQAAARVRAGERPVGNAPFFALFLLAEFRAREALPAILEAIHLPGDGPYALFGDAITENLAGILVTLSDDPLAMIDRLIRNRDLDEFVRWEAAECYLHLVRGGQLRREEAVEYLRRHLRWAIDQGDDSMVPSGLVGTLDFLAPREAYEDIKEAFSKGMVDPFTVRLENIQRSIAQGDAGVARRLNDLTVVGDTIQELRQWPGFALTPPAEPEETPPSSPLLADKPDEAPTVLPPLSEIAPQVQQLKRTRVGRNEPCPCGSGKKYKKCCGR